MGKAKRMKKIRNQEEKVHQRVYDKSAKKRSGLFGLIIIIGVILIFLYEKFPGVFSFHSRSDEIREEERRPTDENEKYTREDFVDFVNDEIIDKSTASIHTQKGDIVIELYPESAPKTVNNFKNLAASHFYDGTKFHRVEKDFVIQGGDPLSKDDILENDGSGGPGYQFEDEINPKSIGLGDEEIKALESEGYVYDDGLQSKPVDVSYVAMANSGPSTNGSQFFIITKIDQKHLYGRHTVFGKVLEGMDVVQSIEVGDGIEEIELR